MSATAEAREIAKRHTAVAVLLWIVAAQVYVAAGPLSVPVFVAAGAFSAYAHQAWVLWRNVRDYERDRQR